MTFPTLLAWADFDDDSRTNGATIIGANGENLAIVLVGEHHDAFLRLALAAHDLLETLETVDAYLAPEKGDDDDGHEIRAIIQTAIAKAKGA